MRKLTPGNGYTDKKIVCLSRTEQITKSGDLWWTNGEIVFFEPAPAGAEERPADKVKTVKFAQMIAQMLHRANIRVYPVEVRENSQSNSGASVRFSDGNGTTLWADAKYVLSILATKRTGKGVQTIDWYVDDVPVVPFLHARNDKKIALLAGQMPPTHKPEWSFQYTGELS